MHCSQLTSRRVSLSLAVLLLLLCYILPCVIGADTPAPAVQAAAPEAAVVSAPPADPVKADGSAHGATAGNSGTTRKSAVAASATGPSSVTPDAPISLRQDDFCVACHSVVEEFHKWTVSTVLTEKRLNQTMTKHQLVEWFCKTGPFAQWKLPLIHGCIKTVQDHYAEVLSPFLGTHTGAEYSTLSAVYKHKMSACSSKSVDACPPPTPQGRARTDCDACHRVAGDIHWVASREVAVNSTVATRILGSVCMEAGMRHERPMEVEAFCHEQVGDHFHATAKELERVFSSNNTASTPIQKKQQLQRELCGHLTEACKDDLKEYKKEAKLKREQEKKDAKIKQSEQKKASAGKKTKTDSKKAQQPAEAGVKDEL